MVNEVTKKIMRIFEASDLEKNRNKVYWVMIKNEEEQLKAKVSFVEKKDEKSFYSEKILRPDSAFIDLIPLTKVRQAMVEFDQTKTPAEMLPEIARNIKENFEGYFVTVTEKYIIIG